MLIYSTLDQKIFEQARTALTFIIDGARYQLEANHRRPTGQLDDTYKAAHDELIAHLLEEMTSAGTYESMEAAQ